MKTLIFEYTKQEENMGKLFDIFHKSPINYYCISIEN